MERKYSEIIDKEWGEITKLRQQNKAITAIQEIHSEVKRDLKVYIYIKKNNKSILLEEGKNRVKGTEIETRNY